MHIILNRSKKGGEPETLGTLTVPAILFGCCSLELPDKGNKSRISCIPEGTYNWMKRNATIAIPYQHIILLNVPGRDAICIHAANYVRQILGCIAVGNSFIDIDKDGLIDVTASKPTFNELMKRLPEKGTIEII